MRTLLLTILLSIFGISIAFADGKKEKSRDEIFREVQEFKMNYLAKEMDLNNDQKTKFFDLYREMTLKRRECMRNAYHLKHKLKKMENPTEADRQVATEAMSKARAEEAAIEKEYAKKFSRFLTQKQIIKMKEGEEAFRKKMEEMKRNSHSKSKNKSKGKEK